MHLHGTKPPVNTVPALSVIKRFFKELTQVWKALFRRNVAI